MLDLGFPETSQSLTSFKQLLFSSFHRGDQWKKNKKPVNPLKNLALHFGDSSFPNRDPLSKMKLLKNVYRISLNKVRGH